MSGSLDLDLNRYLMATKQQTFIVTVDVALTHSHTNMCTRRAATTFNHTFSFIIYIFIQWIFGELTTNVFTDIRRFASTFQCELHIIRNFASLFSILCFQYTICSPSQIFVSVRRTQLDKLLLNLICGTKQIVIKLSMWCQWTVHARTNTNGQYQVLAMKNVSRWLRENAYTAIIWDMYSSALTSSR